MTPPSNIQRWGLLALAVVVLVVGYLLLRPKGDDDDTGSAATTVTQVVTVDAGRTATAEQPTTTTTTTTTEAPAKPQIQTIRVKDGQPVGGVKELDFAKGDTIAFKVTATAPGGEVHFHGYDIAKEIPEGGGSVTYKVPATIEGIFEVEMEATGVQIAKVVVQP
jgi:hypothetical protein